MALPILGSVLGAFGVEAAKLAAPVLDEVLAKPFGCGASEVLEEIGARVRGYLGDVPPNHDLERTLRLVHLTANLLVLKAYEIAQEAEHFDQRSAKPPPFIAKAGGWLRDQIGLCPRMTVRENNALVAEMEAALDGLLRSGDPAEAALRQIAAVEAAGPAPHERTPLIG